MNQSKPEQERLAPGLTLLYKATSHGFRNVIGRDYKQVYLASSSLTLQGLQFH
jgi:hypothetical protein